MRQRAAYLDRALQVMGVLLIVVAFWSYGSDWLIFVMNCALGLNLLITPYGSRDLRRVRRILLSVVFVLAIIRFISFLL